MIFGMKVTTTPIETLGVCIDGNCKNIYDLNFKTKIEKLKDTLNNWRKRHLSIKGKIQVINTLALSPLLYLCSMITVPRRVYQEDIIQKFIWDNKPNKIK